MWINEKSVVTFTSCHTNDINSRFYEKDNQIFADIEANESSLIYWCLQYGESIELVKPAECRQKIQCILQQMNERYNRR